MRGGIGHCDERGHGVLGLQGPWSIVITSDMENSDDRRHRAL